MRRHLPHLGILGESYYARSRPWRLILAFSVLSVILAMVGLTVCEFVADSFRQRENQQLGAIAEFKKDQIANWLSERRGDILAYTESPYVADALAKLRAGPDQNARQQRVSWLEATRNARGYVGIEMLDPDRRIVAGAGEIGRHGAVFEDVARLALEQPGPILLDLHRAVPSDPIRMAYVAAIRDARLPQNPAIGLMVFTIDPERTLYPMLGAWPTASGSGETLIVRRDGDGVLFLSKLRHRNDRPLTLSFPVSRTDIPAVQAVTLGNGIYEGVDYRGASVLSATRAVPGTPWMLVSKVDEQEVFANIRTVAWICGILIFAGIVVVGFFLAMAWRQQRLCDQIQLNQRLLVIVSTIPGALFSLCRDRDGRVSVPYISDGAQDLIGVGPEQLRTDGSCLFGLMMAGERERFEQSLTEAALSQGTWRCEWRIRHPVTGERWIEGNALPQADGDVLWHGHLQDITERKAVEIALDRANRMLRARSLSNLALVRAEDEAAYLGEVCQIIVGACGHTMIWIGYADQGADRRVLPAAVAGLDLGYLERAAITWADDDHGRGPTGTAIRTGQVSVCRDTLGDSRFDPWRDEGVRRGYRSSIALPLTVKDQIVGALTIYAAEPDAFPDDEIRLLGELADDIAFGISVLRLRAAHAQTELSLKDSEEKLRLFIEHAPAALAMFDADMRHLFASRRWLTANRLEAPDIVGKTYDEAYPALFARWTDVFRRCLAGAVEKCDEDFVTWPDGRTDWLRWEVRPWSKGTDTVGGIVVLLEDITEAKRTQEALEDYRLHLEDLVAERTRMLEETVRLTQERAAEIADLYDNAPCGYHSLDPTGLIVRINETELSWLGYSREDVVGKMRFPDFLDEHGKASFRGNFARFLSLGYLPDHEYELQAKDGRRIPVLLTKSSVRDRSGAIVMSRSVVYDLTERKQVEAELARYRDGLEAMVSERTAALSAERQLRWPLGDNYDGR